MASVGVVGRARPSRPRRPRSRWWMPSNIVIRLHVGLTRSPSRVPTFENTTWWSITCWTEGDFIINRGAEADLHTAGLPRSCLGPSGALNGGSRVNDAKPRINLRPSLAAAL